MSARLLTNDKGQLEWKNFETLASFKQKYIPTKPVETLSLYDIEAYQNQLTKTSENYNYDKNELNEIKASDYIYNDTTENIELVKINLDFSESEILEKIKQILRDRKQKNVRKPYQRNTVEWAKQGILIFLDLKTWELKTDNKITYALYADILSDFHALAFPQDPEKIFTEDNVRKTVLVSARKLIETDYIKWLSGHAGYDQSIYYEHSSEALKILLENKDGIEVVPEIRTGC
jgi:hypothetical protein